MSCHRPEDLIVKHSLEELRGQAASRAELEGITVSELVVKAVTRYMASPITLDVKKVIVKRNGVRACGLDSVEDGPYFFDRDGSQMRALQGNDLGQVALNPRSAQALR